MIKIIKEGKILPETEPLKPRVFRNDCPHCETIYEFSEDEGVMGMSDGSGYDLKISCPFCKSPNILTVGYRK